MGNQAPTLPKATHLGHEFGVIRGHDWGEGVGDIVHFDHSLYVVHGQTRTSIPGHPLEERYPHGTLQMSLSEALKVADQGEDIDAFVYDNVEKTAAFKSGVTQACPDIVPRAQYGRFSIYYKKDRFFGGEFFLTCPSISAHL